MTDWLVVPSGEGFWRVGVFSSLQMTSIIKNIKVMDQNVRNFIINYLTTKVFLNASQHFNYEISFKDH